MRARDRLLLFFVPRLLPPVIRLLGATWRVRFVGEKNFRSLDGFIFAFWHGVMLPLLYTHRNRNITVLVSEHVDGEMIARVLVRFGYSLVRGSTTHGGARGLVEMVRLLEMGATVAITPDGPRGPRERFQNGALFASWRSGKPVVPVRVEVSSAWYLSSWDRFVIPKPFARVTIYYGEPRLCLSPDAFEGDRLYLSNFMGFV